MDMKFAGLDQSAYKNGNKSSWTQTSRILLSRNRPKQPPPPFLISRAVSPPIIENSVLARIRLPINKRVWFCCICVATSPGRYFP